MPFCQCSLRGLDSDYRHISNLHVKLVGFEKQIHILPMLDGFSEYFYPYFVQFMTLIFGAGR